MHLHFERTGNTVRSDCTLLSLTWMGKVPDESPTEGTVDEGWTLNRGNYYQEGWLASGNTRGIVGVTYTTAHTKKPPENIPLRTNYNLRGHRAEITLVRWNEPYQKLASCDSTGIIFVWIKYEGRWSIELINDRNTQVTDFAWSHNGRMALICYQDGFVLVGSVAGQRYWSSMLNLDCTISCGLWTPDDQNVYFGTTDGQIIVMDIHGTMLAQISIQADVAITGMAWSCEKFKLEERDDDVSPSPSTSAQYNCESTSDKNKSSPPPNQSKQATVVQQKPATLATAFKNGSIYLMKTYDEVSPIIIETELKGLMLEWSHSGELLAVAGYTVDSKPGSYTNMLKFYTENGYLRYIVTIPNTQFAVSALTWGHNDKRLFLATGNMIHIGWICRKVASLQLLSRHAVYKCLSDEPQVNLLPIPRRLKSLVHYLFAHTIRCYLPDAQSIRDFASKPPPGGLRLHCTMIRHEEVEVTLASATNIGACYTLYLEYLGGLIPLLKGKRNSKIRPEFIIFDPQSSDSSWNSNPFNGDLHSIKLQISSISNGHLLSGLSDDSDSDIEDSCTASPRLQRRRRMRRRMLREQLFEHEQMRLLEDVAYVDSLPEQEKLVEVTSNIWGTKFKIHGLAKFLPANLGSVTYKTSLLHLQPRQMTLMISELRDGLQVDAEPDPNFNPNSFSEDEDEPNQEESFECSSTKSPERRNSIPIAPMTPNKRQISSGTSRHSCRRTLHQRGHISSSNGFQHFLTLEERQRILPPALDGPDDEYVNFYPTSEFLNSVSNHQSSTSPVHESPSPLRSSLCDDRVLPPRNFNQSIHDNVKIKNLVPSVHCQDRPAVSINQFCNGNSNFYDSQFDSYSSLSGPCHQNLGTKTTCGVQESNKTHDSVISVRPKHDKIEKKEKKHRSHQNKLSGDNRAPKRTNENHLPVPTFHWAAKTGDLKFIDDDITDDQCVDGIRKSHLSSPSLFPQKYRSHSIGGHLNNLDVVSIAVPNYNDFHRVNSLRETKKRLMLSQSLCQKSNLSKPKLINCGKSKSLDSGSVFDASFGGDGIFMIRSPTKSPKSYHKTRPLLLIDSPCKSDKRFSNGMYGWDTCNGNISSDRTTSNSSEEDSSNGSCMSTSPVLKSVHFNENSSSCNSQNNSSEAKLPPEPTSNKIKISPFCNGSIKQLNPPLKSKDAELESFELVKDNKDKRSSVTVKVPQSEIDAVSFGGTKSKLSNASGSSSPKSSRTLSPSCMRRALAGASSSILNSPLLNRRKKTTKTEVSDDETTGATADDVMTRDFKDLGSLQKAQLKQKLRKGQKRVNVENVSNNSQNNNTRRRQFTMYNKAPLWNESSQVYQLDFGGRVTQESAKNFQIEFKGKQVMQFGRIDGNAYTLDFQYPFTALQAFAVALANVTQRLK